MDEREIYRKAVMDQIELEKLPKCPFDGKPCLIPDLGCQISVFGIFASNGDEEILWRCPRMVTHNSRVSGGERL